MGGGGGMLYGCLPAARLGHAEVSPLSRRARTTTERNEYHMGDLTISLSESARFSIASVLSSNAHTSCRYMYMVYVDV